MILRDGTTIPQNPGPSDPRRGRSCLLQDPGPPRIRTPRDGSSMSRGRVRRPRDKYTSPPRDLQVSPFISANISSEKILATKGKNTRANTHKSRDGLREHPPRDRGVRLPGRARRTLGTVRRARRATTRRRSVLGAPAPLPDDADADGGRDGPVAGYAVVERAGVPPRAGGGGHASAGWYKPAADGKKVSRGAGA